MELQIKQNSTINNNQLRNHNLKTIQEIVNDIRMNTKGSNSEGMVNLFYNPKLRNPFADRDIEFMSNEVIATTGIQEENKNLSNIYTMHVPVNNKDRELKPVINFDVNLNKPLTEVLEQDYAGFENLIKGFQDSVERNYKASASNSAERREDQVFRKDHQNGYLNAEYNINFIKNNRPTFKTEDEKHLLTFIVGHELAHLSFKERNNIRWDLIDQNQMSNMTQEQMRDLSSVFYSLNRNSNQQSQHFGANYISSRDEIHSDIAGLFLMTYTAMKNGTYNEVKFNDMYRNLGKMRAINNISGDLNGASTHNASIVFEPKNVQIIKNMAAAQLANPNIRIDHEILKLTENLFFQTLKRDGIIIKPLNNNLQVNNEFQTNLKNNPNNFNIDYVYEGITSIKNKEAANIFQQCISEVVPAYQNNCQTALLGNQVLAIDPEGDKIINFNSIAAAVNERGRKMGMDGIEAEKAQIRQEGKVLLQFVNMNAINVRAENQYGDDTIDLSNKQLRFDYVK